MIFAVEKADGRWGLFEDQLMGNMELSLWNTGFGEKGLRPSAHIEAAKIEDRKGKPSEE